MPSIFEPLGKELQNRWKTHVPPRVYPTGFPSLDMKLGDGIHEGQFVIIGGGFGGGKSALAEMIALNMSQRIPVLFVPIEMGKERTEDRFAAKIHKTSIKEFYLNLGSDDVRWRAEAENSLRSLSSRSLGILKPENDAEATVDYMFSEAVKYGVKVLVIDHAREITGWIPLDGKCPAYLSQTNIVQRIRELSTKNKIATILLQQLSQDRFDGKKRPSAWMLQDTSALAQKADVVLLVHLPFANDEKQNTIMEIIVDKNRNGPKGVIHTHWTGHTMSMHPMSREEERDAICCRKFKDAKDVDAYYDGLK